MLLFIVNFAIELKFIHCKFLLNKCIVNKTLNNTLYHTEYRIIKFKTMIYYFDVFMEH